jgi:hypothetical protein
MTEVAHDRTIEIDGASAAQVGPVRSYDAYPRGFVTSCTQESKIALGQPSGSSVNAAELMQ